MTEVLPVEMQTDHGMGDREHDDGAGAMFTPAQVQCTVPPSPPTCSPTLNANHRG